MLTILINEIIGLFSTIPTFISILSSALWMLNTQMCMLVESKVTMSAWALVQYLLSELTPRSSITG